MTGVLWVLSGLLMTLFICWLAGLPEGDTTKDFWRDILRYFAWPTGMRSWGADVRRRGWKAVVASPHHYVVAAGLSTAMLYLGHYAAEHHVAAWTYAVLENITTVGE